MRPWQPAERICPFRQVVARCAISTTMGACFGGCTALVASLIYYKIEREEVYLGPGPLLQWRSNR